MDEKVIPYEELFGCMVRSLPLDRWKVHTIDVKRMLMGRGKEKYMTDIVKVAKEEIANMEVMIKKIDTFLADAPDGCLKCQKKAGKAYFYHQYKTDGTNEWKREYIKKSSSLAETLAQKQYYISIKPILEKNLYELKRFTNKYEKEKADNIYERLSDERKKIVTPLKVSVNEQIKRWQEETYEKNNLYPENLRYETEQGELVRSKSEVIIANILYKHRKDILYKYERPLMLMIDRKVKTIYPDFTILNMHTGKIVYWEHAGRMDDSHYAGEFVKKINAYAANSFLPGIDVRLTFETQGNPLDIGIVNRLVESIIN